MIVIQSTYVKITFIFLLNIYNRHSTAGPCGEDNVEDYGMDE